MAVSHDRAIVHDGLGPTRGEMAFAPSQHISQKGLMEPMGPRAGLNLQLPILS